MYITVQNYLRSEYFRLWKKAEIARNGIVMHYDWFVDLIEAKVPRYILLRGYEIGLNLKEYLPIEQLPEPEKRSLMNEVKEKVKLKGEALANACRVLYYLKKIDNK